jgi:hypothetical protein
MVCCFGSDDCPTEAKIRATRDLNSALEAGWSGFEIAERIPLSEMPAASDGVKLDFARKVVRQIAHCRWRDHLPDPNSFPLGNGFRLCPSLKLG